MIENNVNTYLNTYLNALEDRGYFNGAILIGTKGKIISNRCFGMANFEYELPNTPTTKYRIGSLTKGFTAAAILKLQENGWLHVSDPIGKYIPSVPHGFEITLHHILTHTSGLANHTSMPDYWTHTMRLPFSLDQLLNWYKEQPLEFPPGEGESYSNSAYYLLGHVIEQVSGQSYSDYLHEHIFKPLEMHDSGHDNGSKLLPNRATGYHVWGDIIHIDHVDMSHAFSAYGLYSTIEDLYRWDQGLYSTKILSKASIEQMFTPNQFGTGYGWELTDVVYDSSPTKLAYHFGNINGFNSAIYRFLDEEITIIAISNLGIDAIERIMADLARILHGVETSLPVGKINQIDVNLEDYNWICGEYMSMSEDTPNLSVEIMNDRCFVSMPRRFGAPYKYEIVPTSVDGPSITFFSRYVNESFNFTPLTESNGIQLSYRDVNGKNFDMVRTI